MCGIGREPVGHRTEMAKISIFTFRTGPLNSDAFGVFTARMSSADRVRRVLLCSYTKAVNVFWISPDA